MTEVVIFMIRADIIEDDAQDRAALKGALEKFGKENGVEFVVREYESALIFLSAYKRDADIVFMDIELPDTDGMTAAHSLREVDSDVCLVFVTNMAKLAIKGYEVFAFDFIVKPLSYPNFALKLNRALTHLNARVSKSVIVASGRDKIKLSVTDIYFVEIAGHKIVYHTKSGGVVSYGTLKSVEELLEDDLFVRCNNCYLVNLRHVTAIRAGCAVVGGQQLMISAPRKALFERALADYLCSVK